MLRLSGGATLEPNKRSRQRKDRQMSVTKQARQFRLRACTRCSGDAYADFSEYEPEWRCLQCGRTVPPASLINEDEAWLAA
ncbi:MAG: hypothetical protein DRI30_01120 [Chloroflexi bacterium]|nr:MAG: hypothetical protein DRI30_01120 [Chloroflexota bacterium]